MIKKKASELQVGDEFYRETYRPPDPKVDWSYTVQRLQNVPQYDFFGKMQIMIQVHANNRVTGPATLSLNPQEPVWVVE